MDSRDKLFSNAGCIGVGCAYIIAFIVILAFLAWLAW